MAQPISATKFRNAIRKIDPSLWISVKNIRINGQLRGYSGFVGSNGGSRHVYVSYEVDEFSQDKGMYRVAKSPKDYTGGRNRWARGEDMPERVVALIHSSAYENDGHVSGEN